MKSAGNFAKAKEYAYRLLRYRERSTKEIRHRLKEKGFSRDICDKVITELSKLGYLDDNRFANMLADSIIKFRPGGLALIRSALYTKGIPAKIINSVITDIKDGYDEYETAYALALKRVGRFKNIEPEKAKQRIYSFLSRRRFRQETILEVLNQIFK